MYLTWENREHYLKLIPHRSQVCFALFCAKQVRHLSISKKETEKCINVTELWLEGKATAEECRDAAASAAHASAYAVDAAYYAVDAANAAAHASAYVVDAAYYAVDAACNATYCAANAASAYANTSAYANAVTNANATYCAANATYATYADSSDTLKQEQVNYLRELYIESLPEEERNDWLVVACL